MTAPMRKIEILSAALTLAAQIGYQNVTRDAVAKAAGCSMGTVNYHFGTIAQLRRDLMRAAITGAKTGLAKHTKILAQGLAAKDRYAVKAPPEVKAQAAASLVG